MVCVGLLGFAWAGWGACGASFFILAVLITPSVGRMSITLLASSRLMPGFLWRVSGADAVLSGMLWRLSCRVVLVLLDHFYA